MQRLDLEKAVLGCLGHPSAGTYERTHELYRTELDVQISMSLIGKEQEQLLRLLQMHDLF